MFRWYFVARPALRCDGVVFDQSREAARVFHGQDHHWLRPAADFDVMRRQGVGGQSRGLANFFRQDDFAGQTLRHVLQPRRDIARVAQRGEYHVVALADIADDDFTGVNPDAEADRLAEIVAQETV